MNCKIGFVLALIAMGIGDGGLRADTIYDAADDMRTNELSATPVNPNGVWEYGYRSLNDGVGSETLTRLSRTTLSTITDCGLSGWGYSSNQYQIPAVDFNATDDPCYLLWLNGHSVDPNEFWVHPGQSNATAYSVIRWNAPQSGVVDVAANFRNPLMATTDVHLVRVAADGASTSLFDSYLDGDQTSTSASVSSVSIGAGDRIDLVVGIGSNGNGDSDSTVVSGFTITYVPEPSCIAMLSAVSLVGLLAYAWRKRK